MNGEIVDGEDHDHVLQDAYARGRDALARRLEQEGGCMSTDEAAQRMGITEDEVVRRRRFWLLLGFVENSELAFPRWQFQPDGQPFPIVRELLPNLGRVAFLDFMLTPHPALQGGRRPLDLMRAGDDKLLRELAAVAGEHISW